MTPLSIAADLSGATRMLLASDGSTTLLLESLLDRRLTVRVAAQRTVTAAEAPPRALAALGLDPEHRVVDRASALVTVTGEVVSRNTVVFTAPPRGWSGTSEDTVPLGRRLRDAHTLQHRSLLSSGTTWWAHEDGEGEPCAYKEYLIHCEDGGRLYVHEVFNPCYVPAPRQGVHPRPAPTAAAGPAHAAAR
ncbi:hypothetical protein [Kitasatospora sp. NPDC050543]|uniref:hypothetical protein n=1 Tax=Kitasatospora sp. NPDC050543 TaxID=3364054 RepID=UPI0037959209